MSSATFLLAGVLSGLPSPGATLTCHFDKACIDGRPCFDSDMKASVEVVSSELAVLKLDDGTQRPARLRRDGVWNSIVTAPDLDHGNRVTVLDWTEDGRATLVVSSPGTAIKMTSRTGTCVLTEPKK